jgi:hypothetical protein
MNLFCKNLFILALVFGMNSAWSCPLQNLKASSLESGWEEMTNSSGITESEFNKLINRVTDKYDSIFKRHGLQLKIDGAWKKSEMNAYSDQLGKKRFVYLYGGYARLAQMDKDTYLSVICHEIGHHLGGFPFAPGSTWASSEGQADYFSTLKCMKLILKNDPENERVALSLDLPQQVKDLCRGQYPLEDDYFICLRSAMAAETYGKINAALATPDSRREISLLSPTYKKASFTNLSYPRPQCRVDTKFQGALCNVDINMALGFDDENKGACSIKNGHSLGSRPMCWFVPQ